MAERIKGARVSTDGTGNMSESGLQFKGRPNSQKDNDNQYNLYIYCGGGGAGGCPEPLGVEGVVLEYKVSRLITYNRFLVLLNNNFWGVNITEDDGPDFFCDHSFGNSVDTFMSLSANPNLDIETTAKSSGVVLNDSIGDLIEFDTPLLPQPTDPAWEAKIYVYLWWGSGTYLNGNTFMQLPDERAFNIVKHDNDVRV